MDGELIILPTARDTNCENCLYIAHSSFGPWCIIFREEIRDVWCAITCPEFEKVE